ncbi:MAG: Na(+)/H(+) antiporter subunit B [Acidobacteriota bacterium]
MIEPLSTVFLLFIVVCAVAALSVRDLLAAVVIFSAFSFFSATYFTMLGALDVAFTEAAVGAAITTVFFVTAIYRTSRKAP